MKVGGNPTILIADYHAYLDDRKTPWEEMEVRAKYIETCLKLVLKEEASKIKFVKGSEFQSSKEYIEDMFKLSGIVSVKRAIRSASEVVRIKESPKVSSLIYPVMQNVDVKYVGAELVLGGIDQRHIYALGREILDEINWKKPICIFTPLLTSLTGPETKMSASKPDTHITLHETEENLRKKVLKAYCPPNQTKDNPIIDIMEFVLFPFFSEIKVKTKEGEKTYTNINDLKNDYVKGLIHPLDLKNSLIEYTNILISPVREYFEKHSEFFERVKESMKISGYVID
ncbi:MAG: tyrosine--tRNA ligase [Candidatus Aenigmarchaeota archaeon]|nr:tyrosine--tRNA ligase [Candidatus Aenigmarchaeota archaeon]